MLAKKKEFYGGVGLMTLFVVVLIIVFSPIYGGKNGLDYLDNLYNSISKGSAYYIQKARDESDVFNGTSVSVTITMDTRRQAEQTAQLFLAGGSRAIVTDAQLKVKGDLGQILDNCLDDADAMYKNDGEKVSRKYGYDERRTLFNWWKAFKEMEKDLKKQKRFSEAKIVALVVKKAVESSYNYYRIEPQKIGDRLGIVILSLVSYVIYTLWYGFAIMFMFEGWGMKIGH